MRYLTALLTALVALAFGGQAHAQQVITFDEQAPTENSILGSIECTTSGGSGFRFSSDHFHLIGIGNTSVFSDYSSNGTPHIGYESVRGFPILLERLGGGNLSLRSLDAAEFYFQLNPDRPDAQRITITGNQAGGGVVTHTINLDGIYDGPGGVTDFQHFVLPGTFVNLTSVVFTGLLTNGASGGPALDNIEYQVSAPETLNACVVTPVPSEVPVVTFTSPSAGPVAGTVTVSANATDNVGVVGVQFKLDGVNLGSEDLSAPCSTSWTTTTVADGTHTLTAEARDASGNIGIGSVTVTVQNTPVVSAPHYVELDGSTGYAQVADANALSFVSGSVDTPLTMEMWIRPDGLNNRAQLLGKWGESTNQEYPAVRGGQHAAPGPAGRKRGRDGVGLYDGESGGAGWWLASPGGHV